ncbi:MAG: sugar ABC transporter substrate-binding protein [Actinomycetota bacterium]
MDETSVNRATTRRELLRQASGAAVAAGLGGTLLAACGGSDSSGSATTEAATSEASTTAAAAGTTEAAGGSAATGTGTLSLLARDLEQENFRIILAGCESYTESSGRNPDDLLTLVYKNDSNLEQQVIGGAVDALQGDEKLLLNAWPNTGESTPLIARDLEGKGFFVSHWNKPDGLFPWDVGPQWVAHIAFNGGEAHLQLSQLMFESIGGEGGVCAIRGLVDTTNDQQNYAAFQEAVGEFPGITELDVQPGNWDRKRAFNFTQTWISQFGDELNAIWSSNDDMALGALEALRAAGLAGQVALVGADGVSEAVKAVADGEMTATALFDSYWQGGIGLAIVDAAHKGEIDVDALPHENRAFFGPITIIDQNNYQEYLGERDPSKYDWTDLFGEATGPITT